MTQHADGSDEGLLWSTLFTRSIDLKYNGNSIIFEVVGVAYWGLFDVRLNVQPASSPAFMMSRSVARHVTMFARSHSSNDSIG